MSGPEAISYITLLAFGPAISVFVLRQTLPSLPTFARVYAVLLFAACIALLAAHALIRIPPYYDKVLWVDRWLWNVKNEYSIPTTFATLQLAIIALLAILTALSAKSKPAWHRLYFLAFGWVFIYLALDEYYLLHEANDLLYGANICGHRRNHRAGCAACPAPFARARPAAWRLGARLPQAGWASTYSITTTLAWVSCLATLALFLNTLKKVLKCWGCA